MNSRSREDLQGVRTWGGLLATFSRRLERRGSRSASQTGGPPGPGHTAGPFASTWAGPVVLIWRGGCFALGGCARSPLGGLPPSGFPPRAASRSGSSARGGRCTGAAAHGFGEIALLPDSGSLPAARRGRDHSGDLPADRFDARSSGGAAGEGHTRSRAPQPPGRRRTGRRGARLLARRSRPALRLSRAGLKAELSAPARPHENRAPGHRRSPLREPVGARFPTGLHAARRTARVHKRADDGTDSHGHRSRPRRDRGASRPAGPGAYPHRLRASEPRFLGAGAADTGRTSRGLANRIGRGGPRHASGAGARNRLLQYAQGNRSGGEGSAIRRHGRPTLSRRPHETGTGTGSDRLRGRALSRVGGDERLRHGDRHPRHPLDRALSGPGEPRGLLPGGGSRRSGRAGLALRALLWQLRLDDPAATDVDDLRRSEHRSTSAGGPRGGVGVRSRIELSPGHVGRALHRGGGPDLRALRRLPRRDRGRQQERRDEAPADRSLDRGRSRDHRAGGRGPAPTRGQDCAGESPARQPRAHPFASGG